MCSYEWTTVSLAYMLIPPSGISVTLMFCFCFDSLLRRSIFSRPVCVQQTVKVIAYSSKPAPPRHTTDTITKIVCFWYHGWHVTSFSCLRNRSCRAEKQNSHGWKFYKSFVCCLLSTFGVPLKAADHIASIIGQSRVRPRKENLCLSTIQKQLTLDERSFYSKEGIRWELTPICKWLNTR